MPVGGNDEGAALETVLQRHGAPGERISADGQGRCDRRSGRRCGPTEHFIVRDNDRESMSIPHFVRRAAGRVMVGGVICALVVGLSASSASVPGLDAIRRPLASGLNPMFAGNLAVSMGSWRQSPHGCATTPRSSAPPVRETRRRRGSCSTGSRQPPRARPIWQSRFMGQKRVRLPGPGDRPPTSRSCGLWDRMRCFWLRAPSVSGSLASHH